MIQRNLRARRARTREREATLRIQRFYRRHKLDQVVKQRQLSKKLVVRRPLARSVPERATISYFVSPLEERLANTVPADTEPEPCRPRLRRRRDADILRQHRCLAEARAASESRRPVDHPGSEDGRESSVESVSRGLLQGPPRSPRPGKSLLWSKPSDPAVWAPLRGEQSTARAVVMPLPPSEPPPRHKAFRGTRRPRKRAPRCVLDIPLQSDVAAVKVGGFEDGTSSLRVSSSRRRTRSADKVSYTIPAKYWLSECKISALAGAPGMEDSSCGEQAARWPLNLGGLQAPPTSILHSSNLRSHRLLSPCR